MVRGCNTFRTPGEGLGKRDPLAAGLHQTLWHQKPGGLVIHLVSGPWGVPSHLRMEIFVSLFRRAIFVAARIAQLMEHPLQHWPICGTNVSFRAYLHCLPAFHRAPAGIETDLCWLVIKVGNCLCVDLTT